MSGLERCGEFKSRLGKILNPGRYLHCLAVAHSAARLAELYGADREKAYVAGLLHDATKNIPFQIQLQMLENGGIILTREEKANPALWHAMSASVYLKSELAVCDEQIILAVRYHTTGRAGMSLLEKIIYIADYVSPDRRYPDVDVMRRLSLESLDSAALYSLKYTFSRCTARQSVIHPDSVEFYNELIIKGAANNDRA